jgi:predicted RNA-binding protein Jag
MAVAPKAIEWLKSEPNEIIFGEGDRLNNKAFFEAAGENLKIIHLTVSDESRRIRYEQRGSDQSEKFIQTTKTKVKNIIEEFGPKTTLFGEEEGCVHTFSHETPEDTMKIVDFMLSC